QDFGAMDVFGCVGVHCSSSTGKDASGDPGPLPVAVVDATLGSMNLFHLISCCWDGVGGVTSPISVPGTTLLCNLEESAQTRSLPRTLEPTTTRRRLHHPKPRVRHRSATNQMRSSGLMRSGRALSVAKRSRCTAFI